MGGITSFGFFAAKQLRNHRNVEKLLNKVTGLLFIVLGIQLLQSKTA